MARKKSKRAEADLRLARAGCKVLKWLLVTCVILLVWLALDDITTGYEPDFKQEYSVVLAGIILIPMLLYWKPGRKVK